jgi:quinohemoprotein ethanol dehydrogenase
VAVLAGWGGVFPLAAGEVAFKSGRVRNISRMLAFKIGGKASLPELPKIEEPVLNPPAATADTATVKNGELLFQRYCAACHGDVAVSGGVLPDLRYSSTLAGDQWFDIVLGGKLKKTGMTSFAKELSRKDAADVRAYVIFRANQSLEEEKGKKKPSSP